MRISPLSAYRDLSNIELSLFFQLHLAPIAPRFLLVELRKTNVQPHHHFDSICLNFVLASIASNLLLIIRVKYALADHDAYVSEA